MADKDSEFELRNVICKLREELQAAAKEGDGKALRFKVESIDLELKVGVTSSKDGEAGVKFSVLGFGVEAGGGVAVEKERVQTLRLKLVPERRDGGPELISGTSDAPPPAPTTR